MAPFFLFFAAVILMISIRHVAINLALRESRHGLLDDTFARKFAAGAVFLALSVSPGLIGIILDASPLIIIGLLSGASAVPLALKFTLKQWAEISGYRS